MWWFRGMRAIFERMIAGTAGPQSGARVLDVGCGTGAMARWMAARYGWEVTGLDLSEEGLGYARGRGPGLLVRGDARRIPFRAACFDGLTSFDVLVHLESGEEAEALREMARCVRPGGWVFLRVAAFQGLRSRHAEYVGERQRYRLGRLVELAEACGMEVQRASYANTLLLPAAWTKFRIWEPLVHAPVESGVKLGPGWLEAALYRVLRAEAWWLGRGGRLPVGQTAMLVARNRNSGLFKPRRVDGPPGSGGKN